MQSAPLSPQDQAELAPLTVIRTETVLSRYPVHRLAKKGSISILLHEQDGNGVTTFKWKVSHNSEFGQPGPLAYKLDTLIVNRRIEEAARPIPKIIKLGSLHEVCRELGVNEGQAKNHIRKSLYQNASAFITAKIQYKANDGSEQTLEAGFTRYSVVFTGEKLPDDRTADAVYLVLNDIYMQVINGAQTRPLDYDYLKMLPPASQRFYELLSYQIYAALKHHRSRAKLSYSEYCRHAPQTRYTDFDRVKKQMYKVHAPHRKSGYIADVSFEATTDKEGRADWSMLYTPGPKAKAEYRAFTKRGGPRVLEVEASPPPEPKPAPRPEPKPEPTQLELEMIERGVTPATAAELVRQYPEERIAAQVEQFDWLLEKQPKKVKESPGGYLASAIRDDYAAPKGFVSKSERARREEAEREKQRREVEEARAKRAAEARERDRKKRIDAYWANLDATERAELEAEALRLADPEIRQSYEKARLASLRDALLKTMREAHIRKLLGLDESSPPVH